MKMRHFLFEVHLPDGLDALVRLVLIARIIEIALGVLVHQKVLKGRHAGVFEAPVPRDVLFLDHGDLVEELPPERRRIEIRDVHIEVHRLLFRRRDDIDGELGLEIAQIPVEIEVDVVEGMTVLRDGGAAGHDLGIIAHEAGGIAALFQLHEIGIAVEMIEVLEEREVELLFHIAVLLVHGEIGGEVDGKLLIADGVLQNALVGGLQPRDALLLQLFPAP